MSEELDDLATVTFDHDDDSVLVIVGSGAGGGTLANEVSQKGIDVVVLEAGPRFQATDFENDEYAMSDMLAWRDKRTCTGTSPIAENFSTPAASTSRKADCTVRSIESASDVPSRAGSRSRSSKKPSAPLAPTSSA